MRRSRWQCRVIAFADVQFYGITTNQAAIINLFRVVNRYVGNLAPMPGVFLNHPLR